MDIYDIRQALGSGKTIYDLPLRVTYYARVSTDKDEQLHSLSAQIGYYNEFIAQCPQWTLVRGYVDEGISGTSVNKRENFLQMIRDAERCKFDFIITKEISRFSRNTLDSIRYTQQLLRCGVGVLFQSDNINTLLPDAELRLTIMSSVAQEEVRKISERVRFGFKRAVENGVVLGSNRIWGYRKQNGTLVIDEEEAKIVRIIFDLYANQRLGIRTVAANLTERGFRNSNGNPFSFSTIRGILSNPKYKGWYCGGKSTKVDYKLNTVKTFSPEEWVQYEDSAHVPPIVSEALWERANTILRERADKQSAADRTSYQNKYPYSGKIFCGVHHSPCYRGAYRYKSGDREVWRCREYVRAGRKGCQVISLYTDEINRVLRESAEEVLENREELLQELMVIYAGLDDGGKWERELAGIQTDMEEIRRRKDRLLDLNIDGKISDAEFATRNARFNAEYEKLDEKVRGLRTEQEKKRETLATLSRLEEAVKEELTFEHGFTGGVVDALLDRMEIFPGEKKNTAEVHVFLRFRQTPQVFHITRKRGSVSVCSGPYI